MNQTRQRRSLRSCCGAVNRLYARIIADSCHRDVEMLHIEEVRERRFADWPMAHVNLAGDDLMVQMKHPEFDPYSAAGAFVMTLVEELLASGQRICLRSA